MQVNIQLSLRTQEVYQLFVRRISGDRLFIEAILHKFNIALNHSRQQPPQALIRYTEMRQKITGLTQHFNSEAVRFETLLKKKKNFENKKISYAVKFQPSIIVTNPLTIQLIEFIEIYDKLIAILKLLHLAGCFDSDEAYFGNIKHFQKVANTMLSDLILARATTMPNDLNAYLLEGNIKQ